VLTRPPRPPISRNQCQNFLKSNAPSSSCGAMSADGA
jgi:hypothetical protein